MSAYATALYFRKAAILEEKGSVKIGKETVDNAIELKSGVIAVLLKEVEEGKDNPFSIWNHNGPSTNLQNAGSLLSGRNPLATNFTFDVLGGDFGYGSNGNITKEEL